MSKNPDLNGPEAEEVYVKAIGLHKDRLKPNRENRREVAIIRAWQADNDYREVLDSLFEVTSIQAPSGPCLTKISPYTNERVYLPLEEVTARDRIVAETVVQYMMSNCGISLVIDAMTAEGYEIKYPPATEAEA